MPLGPSVLLTRSPTAIAPTNDDSRAFSARSSEAFSPKMGIALSPDCVNGAHHLVDLGRVFTLSRPTRATKILNLAIAIKQPNIDEFEFE